MLFECVLMFVGLEQVGKSWRLDCSEFGLWWWIAEGKLEVGIDGF